MAYSMLIVDDSLPMRSVIKKTIKAAGYSSAELLEASNGKEALEQMEKNWVDIVMTDYNMPVMNGLDLVRELKQGELTQDIPVVVISTEGHASKIEEFMAAGAAGYITKPFTAEKIRDLIVTILGEVEYEGDLDESDNDLDF